MAANEPRKSKAERREAARREAERLAAKQAATEKRNRLIIVVASVLVVALIGVAGFFIWKESQRTLLTEFEGVRPAASTDTGGITFGSGLEAGTVNEGATEVQIYIDFMCPVCGSYDQVNRDDIRTMLSDGDATVIFHPLNFLDGYSTEGDYSTRATNAFVTAATDAPEAALDLLELLFDNQPAEGGPGLTDEEIAALAVEAGVPQEVADTFADRTYGEWVAVASDQARNDGVTGTPTTFLDGSRWSGDWSTPGTLLQAVRDAA